MGSTALTDWLSISSFSWSLMRIAIVWFAFYGAGSLIMRIGVMKKYFRLLPSVIPGMLIYMGITALLSLFHILTRTVLPVFIISGALTGLVILYLRLKKLFSRSSLKIRHPLIILPLMLAAYLLVTNLMIAGRPEMNFNDTHVTYLVQPDRWLNDGQINFLDETVFSAFPMTSEMLLLLPSSLAEDRIDQLILGQLFELSMTAALILFSMVILGLGWKWSPAALISISGCSTVLLWSHFAKPDATALFFVTLALIILIKQILERDEKFDLSAFVVMGLALTSKLTAYFALVPFLVMWGYIILRGKPGKYHVLSGAVLLSILPLIFAVRTFIHTGTFFYPHASLKSMLKPEWLMPQVDLTFFTFNNRSSEFFPSIGFFQNIMHYFGTWNSSIFLLLGGFFLTIRNKYLTGRTIVITAFAIYSVISLIIFYPAWWGAKYGILLIPSAALFGLYMFRPLKYGLLSATLLTVLVYFIYDTSISPTEHYGLRFRNELIESYISQEWSVYGAAVLEEQPELGITLWMNSHLPDDSTVLSFYLPKRYFSNHRWINAMQYPPAAHLYLDNCLADEIEILEKLDINYIVIIEGNPAPFDDENRVELFSRIGRGDLLEPLASIDGHTIYRFCPSNL
ncbi:MAG: hypothetical protein ABFR50_06445 [Candidatus Fermentibacteria bacterium]